MDHKHGTAFFKLDGLLVKVVAQPTVRVKNFGDGSDAVIYSTNSVHATQLKSNPFTGNDDGSWDFYVPDTRISVELSGGTPALGTVVTSDHVAYDPFIHFSHSNFNSGYIYQQNSAGLAAPVSVFSLGLVAAGQDYVRLTGVSCGFPIVRYNPTSGVPVLDLVMTGTGWLQAWRTSSGHGGSQTTLGFIDNLGALYSQSYRGPLGSPTQPVFASSVQANSVGGLAGLYFAHSGAPALTGSGGALTLIVDAASGAVLSGKTYSGNACGLTTSSQIITASKAIAVSDMGITQVCSTATNITLTISAGVNSGGTGRVLPIFRAGAGTVTVTSGGAVTILGKQFTVNSLSGASLEWIANDVWLFRA